MSSNFLQSVTKGDATDLDLEPAGSPRVIAQNGGGKTPFNKR